MTDQPLLPPVDELTLMLAAADLLWCQDMGDEPGSPQFWGAIAERLDRIVRRDDLVDEGCGWQILPPDDPRSYPDGYAVVTGDWTAGLDRAEHYVAERMTRRTAELLVAALVAADPNTPNGGTP